MRTFRTVALMCVLVAPGWATCRAQSAPRKVYRMTDSITLVERADTVLFIRSPDADVSRDSIAPDGKPVVVVVLFQGDSTYVLVGATRTPMNPAVAKHLRVMLAYAREEAAGRLPRPPGLKQ